MKAIWKGSIGFGLVNIPVRLFSAIQSSSLNLDMLDRRDQGKIRFHRVNEHTGKEVKWEDIAKAYKYNGEYVILDETDFAHAAPEKSKIIEVNQFVETNEIDTIYYENSYYIEPETGGAKAYALLRESLTKSGKVGVAQFVLRTSATLCVLKPYHDILVLSKIRFAEEVRDPGELKLPPKSSIKPAELKMAVALIDQYTSRFKIETFKDEYAAALLRVIKDKASGKKQTVKKMRIIHHKKEDLMEQLKASLKKKAS